MNAFWELLLPSPMCCVIAVFCQVYKQSYLFLGGTHLVIKDYKKAQPSNYGNMALGLDMQWHSKLL